MASESSSAAVKEFWEWAKANGASAESVQPTSVEEGLGLVARRDLSRGQVVVEVPQRLWIGPNHAVASSDIRAVCAELKPSWLSVALFLARERAVGDASSWRPYINILPNSTDSPFSGTQLLSSTLGVKDYVETQFANVEQQVIRPNKHLFPSNITSADLLWAFGMLRSRVFSSLRGENLVLIPLADLLHCYFRRRSVGDEGKGLFSRELIFSLRTPASVKEGEQIYIQYDLEKSDAELALDYGFIESRSDRNVYTLTLEISEFDPFIGDKLDIAELNGMGETAYFDIRLGSPLPDTMLPYLRLVALGGQDAFLLESLFRNTVWGHLQLPVSRANEEMICRVVRDACKAALSAYHTTIEEDEELLQRGNLEPRVKIAVGIRAGEKKVLQQIDAAFDEREAELDVLEYYQERRLRDLGLVGEQGEIIFWE